VNAFTVEVIYSSTDRRRSEVLPTCLIAGMQCGEYALLVYLNLASEEYWFTLGKTDNAKGWRQVGRWQCDDALMAMGVMFNAFNRIEKGTSSDEVRQRLRKAREKREA
jgi:hypothetical protein